MGFYKLKKILKKMGKSFIKQSIESFDNFNKGKLSKKSIGELVRASHFSTPFSMIILLLFSPKILCQFLLFYLILLSLSFLIFDGCFLTRIEQNYCKDDFSIIDPCLEIHGMEKTNKNRFLISIPIGIVYTSVAFLIYFIRFAN